MEQKDLIALLLLLAGAAGGMLLSCVSKRARDLFFVLMVALSAVTERVDVNFVSRDWYRGTTRGFEVSLVDVLSLSVLAGAVLAPRRGEKRCFWPASFGGMLLFFAFAAVCVALTEPKLFGLFELSKMVRGMIIFLAAAYFVRSDRELRLLVLALGLAVAFEGLSALYQRYHDGIHRVCGSVDDSNSLSMYFCLTAPVLLAAMSCRFSKVLKVLCAVAVALACVGVMLTISRAGIVTMILVLLITGVATVSFQLTPKKIVIAAVALLAMTGIVAKGWNSLNTRFSEFTLKEEIEDKHSMGRGYYIRIAAAIADDRWFGVGPNNWSYWVSNHYGPKLGWRFVPYLGTDKMPSDVVPAGRHLDEAQAAPAHSLAALTAGEMGLGGLILLALLWLRWFQMGAVFLWKRTAEPMQRMGAGFFFGTCGIFFQSLTEWVYRQTPIYFTFHILLGALASLYYVRKRALRAQRAPAEPEPEPYLELAPEPAGLV